MWYKTFGWEKNIFSTKPTLNVVGLDKEKKEILESAESGRIVHIKGGVGEGKTSLLLWLNKKLEKRNRTPLLIDCIEINKLHQLQILLRKRRGFFDKILCRKYPKYSVLLLDECDQIPSQTLEGLRSMWDKNQIFSIVLASIDAYVPTFSPPFSDRIGKIINLTTLSRGDLVEILRSRITTRNPFTPEALMTLVELSKSSPRKLLEKTVDLCQYCSTNKIYKIDENVVRSYCEEMCRKEKETVRLPIQPIQYKTLEKQPIQYKTTKSLSPMQQKIAEKLKEGINTVGHIAREIGTKDEAIRQQLDRMRKKGVIIVKNNVRPKQYKLSEQIQ